MFRVLKSTIKLIFIIWLVFYPSLSKSQLDTNKLNEDEQLHNDFGITRNRNRHFGPIIYRHQNEQGKDLQLAFTLYQRKENFIQKTVHTHFLPLYWKDKSPNSLDFRLGTVYYPSLFQYYADSLRELKQYRVGALFPGIDFLNVSKSKNGLYVENNLFFFIWAKRDLVHHQSRLIVFPLYFYNSHYARTTHTLVPLFRATHDTSLNQHSLNIYPLLFFRYKKPREQYATALLLYHQGQNYWKNTHYWGIIPLYYRSRKSGNSTTTMITPLFWRETSPTMHRTSLVPLFWREHGFEYGNTFVSTLVLPIYYRYKSEYTLSQSLFIAPIYYHFKSPTIAKKVIFPLYAKFWDSSMRSNRTVQFLSPLFLTFQKTSFNSTNKLISSKRTQILFPFGWSYRRLKISSSIGLFPLYSCSVDSIIKSKLLSITPIYWSYKHNFERFHLLFPIWYHRKDFIPTSSTKINRWGLLPSLFYSTESNNQGLIYRSFTFIPFYFGEKTKIDSIHFRTKQWISLIFWRDNSPSNSTWALIPLIYQSKKLFDTVQIFTPLVWLRKTSSYKSTTILPLLHYRSNYSRYDTSSKTWIFPSYSHYQSKLVNSISLYPFYSYLKTTDNLGNTSLHYAIYPFVYRLKNHNQSSFKIFPIAIYDRNIDYRKLSIFPVYYSKLWKSGSETTSIGWLYWKKTTRNKLVNSSATMRLLVPIYYNLKLLSRDTNFQSKTTTEEITSSTAYTPLIWMKTYSYNQNKPNGLNKRFSRKLNILPLVYSSFNLSVKTAINPKNSLTVLGDGKEYFDSSNLSRFNLFPIYFSKDYSFNDWFSYKIGNDKNFWLNHYHRVNIRYIFPFYFKKLNYRLRYFQTVWDSTGNGYKFIIKSFRNDMNRWEYLVKNEYIDKTILFFPVISNSTYSPIDSTKTSNFTVFPLYFGANKSDNFKRRVIFPVFWYYKSDKSAANMAIFPIYLKHKTLFHSVHAITPLYWSIDRYKKVNFLTSSNTWCDSMTTVKYRHIFPFYYSMNNGIQRNSSFMYFVYRKHVQNNQLNWSVLWPLITYKKDTSYQYFHIAPIWWQKRSDTLNYTVLFPIYYHKFNREYSQTNLVWQLYKHVKSASVNQHHFLWKCVISDNYSNGDFEHRLFYKLWVSESKNGYNEKVLFPFYSIQTWENGDYSKRYFFSLFQKTKTKIPNTTNYYLEERIFWLIRTRSNFNYLKSQGIITNRKIKV